MKFTRNVKMQSDFSPEQNAKIHSIFKNLIEMSSFEVSKKDLRITTFGDQIRFYHGETAKPFLIFKIFKDEEFNIEENVYNLNMEDINNLINIGVPLCQQQYQKDIEKEDKERKLELKAIKNTIKDIITRK